MSPVARNRSDVLAAEFALGCLGVEKTAEVRQRCREDRAFAATVEAWQGRLFPLARALPREQPPTSVWEQIERSLSPETAGRRFPRWHLKSRLPIVGGFGLAAALVLGLLVTSTTLPLHDEGGPRLVSELTTEDGSLSWTFAFDGKEQRLTIHRHGEMLSAGDHDLELWLIAQDGSLRSLGLIPDAAEASIAMDTLPLEGLTAGASLAISREPPGGSPASGPSGPVIAAASVSGF